jgi:ABC-type transport system substrate-binding protein
MADFKQRNLSLSRRGFIAASGATLATLTLPRAVRAQDKDVLRYGLSADPPGLNPFQLTGAAADTVKLQIYRSLVGLDQKGKLVGELAEKWEQEKETSYTFHIRKNAVFQNGEPVTAADVRWSFQQITKDGSTAFLVSDLKVISSIDVIDDKTVRINLSAPTASFLKLLATPYAPVISAKAGLEKPVGAGPYRISKSERGVSIDFEAFEHYYKEGYPKTKKMRMIVYKDESLRVAALESGDVDIIEYVPWQSMAKVESNPNLVLQETSGPDMVLVFNVAQPPFNDPRVRQAVAYAIKREDIVNAAFYGRGWPLYGLPLDQGSEFASAKTENLWSYDPDKAKSLLKQAGVIGQKATLLATSTYSMHQDTAQIVQQYVNAVGLQVELQLPEWGSRVAQGDKGQYQFAINGVSMTVDDPDGLTGMIGSGPVSYRRSFGYSNQKLDELLEKGRHELDPAKRKADYEALAEVFKEDVPICTLTRRSQGYGLRKSVKNFQALPGSVNGYSGFLFEEIVLG